MRKGTTPTLTFTIPFDTAEIDCLRIILANDNNVILVKDDNECTLKGNEITVQLTQEETFLFDCDSMNQVQIRIKMKSGEVVSSDILKLPVKRCLDSEVL